MPYHLYDYLYPFEALPKWRQDRMIEHASHLDADLEGLIVSASSIPETVLANPTLLLGLATNPDLITDTPVGLIPGASNLVKHPDAPMWLIGLALTSACPRVVIHALKNPSTPQHLIERAAQEYANGEGREPKDPWDKYQLILVGREESRDDILHAALARLPFGLAREITLQSKSKRAFERLLLRTDTDFMTAHALLAHAPPQPEEDTTLQETQTRGIPLMQEYEAQLATRPDAPESYLLDLAPRISHLLAHHIISSPTCTPAVVEALYDHHGATYIEPQLLTCPVTPPQILRALAEDPKTSRHEQIAAHPNTPPEILAELAKHHNAVVAAVAASNPNTSNEAIRDLLNHTTPAVTAEAARHPSITWTDLPNNTAHLAGAALNPNTTPEQQQAALKALHRETGWLNHIAISKLITPAMHATLITHEEPDVRSTAIKHSLTTPEQLRQASQDPGVEVRSAVILHDNTPSDVIYGMRLDDHDNIKTLADDTLRKRGERRQPPR